MAVCITLLSQIIYFKYCLSLCTYFRLFFELPLVGIVEHIGFLHRFTIGLLLSLVAALPLQAKAHPYLQQVV